MAQLKKILLVVGDEDLRKALTEQLMLSEDFKVSEGPNGAQAIEKVHQQSFDLIVLDVGLPDTDGRELCRLMREHGVKSPMLMLTGSDTDASKVLGLDAGTNDYITKPFKFPVLLARSAHSSDKMSNLRMLSSDLDPTCLILPVSYC